MLGFIIFGTRGITKTADTGEFYCPRCARQTRYALKRVRRFFTLYFIPLIPLDVIGQYVECSTCRESWKEDILRMPPVPRREDLAAAIEDALKKIVVLSMRTRSDGATEQRAAASFVNSELTRAELPEGELEELDLRARGRQFTASLVLRPIVQAINAPGKETLLRAAILTAIQDGDLSAGAKELVLEVAEALDVTRAHLRGIVEEVFAGRGPTPKILPDGSSA